MSFDTDAIKVVERELREVGGRLEWVSKLGVGISFPPETTDDRIAGLAKTIQFAVWISFRGTKATESTLVLLRGAPRLEAVDLRDVPLTTAGLEALLDTTPTICELTVSRDRVGDEGLAGIQSRYPKVQVIGS